MSQVNNHKNTAGRVMGGAMVALSGFVPMPEMAPSGVLAPQNAFAASTTANVTGSFITGIVLGSAVSIKFGKFVATSDTGVFGVKQGADNQITGASVKGVAVSGIARGKFKITLLVSQSIDITVTKAGDDFKLSSTTGGNSNGDITLKKIDFAKEFASTKPSVTVKTGGGGGTTMNAQNVSIIFTELSGGAVITMGATVGWTGGRAVGQIANGNGGNIVMNITF